MNEANTLDALFSDEIIKEIVDQSISEDRELHQFYYEQKTHILFVFHIPDDWSSHHLLQMFVPFDALYAVVMKHDDTGQSKGFGFVHFASRYQAQMGIHAVDGMSA
eukprot:CAMPEP_0202712806 /NCGR_PEP_ID=MMETSP1385-20130828/46019_1 /ASSEMBLY_ACC=CAM_ASM_000861 /TAXON_ID=933848 /ORGANISM="Elphidium margaritaceum" /LENGTH=105 /DNA_ID=CAMNT_0049372967 /DNA_START=64 /DNA_END=377 /DNA_ORIENTATION=+